MRFFSFHVSNFRTHTYASSNLNDIIIEIITMNITNQIKIIENNYNVLILYPVFSIHFNNYLFINAENSNISINQLFIIQSIFTERKITIDQRNKNNNWLVFESLKRTKQPIN